MICLPALRGVHVPTAKKMGTEVGSRLHVNESSRSWWGTRIQKSIKKHSIRCCPDPIGRHRDYRLDDLLLYSDTLQLAPDKNWLRPTVNTVMNAEHIPNMIAGSSEKVKK
jgi:hypothetical protein